MNRRDFLRGLLTYTAATALGSMAAQLGGRRESPLIYLTSKATLDMWQLADGTWTTFPCWSHGDTVDASPYLIGSFGGILSPRKAGDSGLMAYVDELKG